MKRNNHTLFNQVLSVLFLLAILPTLSFAQDDYAILFPQDTDWQLGTPLTDTVEIQADNCDLFSSTYTDELLDATGPECYKIVRTFRVINWCLYDGNSVQKVISRDEDCDGIPGNMPVWVIHRSDGSVYIDQDNDETNALPAAGTKGTSCDNLTNPQGYWLDNTLGATGTPPRDIDPTGYWQYSQFIDVFEGNEDKLVFDSITSPICITDNVSCLVEQTIAFTAQTCAIIEDSFFQVRIDLDNDGNFDEVLTYLELDGTFPNYSFSYDFPIGTHLIEAKRFGDGAPDIVETLAIEVISCNAGAPVCINGLAVELLPLTPPADVNGDGIIDSVGIQVWATDLIANPVTNCSGEVILSINRSGDMPHPDSSSIIVTCEDLGIIIVEIYAWDNTYNPYAVQPDGTVGGPNYDFCETYMLIQDVWEVCGPQEIATINGQITNKDGVPLEGVQVFIGSGIANQAVYTDENGNYSAEVWAGQDYSIIPLFDDFPLNGLDSNDLLAWDDVVANSNNPYLRIACDLNSDSGISSFDAVLLDQAVSFGIANFPAWRFVDASYVFPNPMDPWSPSFPEVIILNVIEADEIYSVDFIGIKVGDLDCSANTDLTQSTAGLLEGTIFEDENGDCTLDPSDIGLIGWTIKASGANGHFFANTEADGSYELTAPPGDYVITVIPPVNYWVLCNNEVAVTLEQGVPFNKDFGAFLLFECPYLEVDISAFFLRRCFPNFYTVNYCNEGTAMAEDAYVEVTLDDYMTYTTSTIPFTAVDGNTYTFPVGDLEPGECGYFKILFDLSCDATLGQTHCTEAKIFPDTICGIDSLNWDGASLELNGACLGDTIQFEISNRGAAMQSSVQYVVVEDHLIMLTGEVQLGADESTFVQMDGDGSTKRLEVPQTEGHPGNSHPSLSIEGCGMDENGGFSLGFVTQFTEDDENATISIDCQENVGAFDPNDKRGYPKGVGLNHLIEADTRLDYHIRFQNTGTDTAFNVVVVDTLSPTLDPATVRPGASSHPYEYHLSGEGVLTFVFENIMLPDSNINELESHGFVKFSVAQQSDNPIGTIIENSAAIHFDFNAPIWTNYTFHTVGEHINVPETAAIAGEVKIESGEGLDDVAVQLVNVNGNADQLTTDGAFGFENQPTLQAYELHFEKDSPVWDGVNVLDIILVVRHILGSTTLSPLQKLAADVDGSGSITISDLVHIQRVILGLSDQFPVEQVWAFAQADQSQNPWSVEPANVLNIAELLHNQQLEVYAYKFGDIDNTAAMSLHGVIPREALPIHLGWTVTPVEEGWNRVDVRAETNVPLQGMQLMLDVEGVAGATPIVPGTEVGLHESDFYQNKEQVRMVWHSEEATDLQNVPLFSWLVKGAFDPSWVRISEDSRPSVAYDASLRPYTLVWPRANDPGSLSGSGIEVQPNPSSGEVRIQYYVDAEQPVSLKLFDGTGRLIDSWQQDRAQGWQELEIEKGVLETGTYYIQLQTFSENKVARFVIL